MRVSNPVVDLVRQWAHKAENDLKNAAAVLKLGKECPTDTVGFHAQQCVEKYLKALLVFHGTDFPKVHDIEALVRLLPRAVLANWSLREQRKLTGYAVVIRYPGDYADIPLAEARAAVRIARRVRREIRKLLPRAALRKKAG